MRETDSPGPVEDSTAGLEVANDDTYLEDDSEFDWIVFLLRVSALVTFGATLIVAVDLSLNQDVEWQTVMRLSILPFVGGMLLLAAAELLL